MPRWECAIEGCGQQFERAEDALVHQTTEHERRECKVCGAVLPDGYFLIKHAFEEHTRADYVRAYEASPEDVRRREQIKEDIEAAVDIREVLDRVEAGGFTA